MKYSAFEHRTDRSEESVNKIKEVVVVEPIAIAKKRDTSVIL